MNSVSSPVEMAVPHAKFCFHYAWSYDIGKYCRSLNLCGSDQEMKKDAKWSFLLLSKVAVNLRRRDESSSLWQQSIILHCTF